MDQNTVCPECGTQNEPDYEFCKNCGAPLIRNEAEPQPSYFTPPADAPQNNAQHQYQNGSQYQGGYAPPPYASYTSQEGIPAEDFAIFIGKKADRILPKFMQMELSGSKVSWCWPIAILAWFLGPIGAGFWFLYRKMFKPAILLFTIGIVLDVAVSAFTPNINIDPSVLTGDMYQSFTEIYNALFTGMTPVMLILSYISKFLYLLTCALTGIFAYHLYKKHCVTKILSYRQSGIDMRFYKLGLASVGGTSAGFLVIGVFSVAIIKSLLTFVVQYMF